MKKDFKMSNDLLKPPKIGEIIKGKIIGLGRSTVYLDLGAFGAGIIYGKEFYEGKEVLKELKIGDSLLAKIIDLENEEGYIELSISQAGKELAWGQLAQKKEEDEILKVKILEANKGGLLAEVLGVQAFLPVSQLSSGHYPRVEGGDQTKILKELKKFIGQELEVKILDLSQKEGKVILSEKAKEVKKIKKILKNYKVGDIVEGEITAILDFGVFLRFSASSSSEADRPIARPPLTSSKTKSGAVGGGEEKLEGTGPEFIEGLIHISELDWQLIENPSEIVKVGEKIKVKIIKISDEKVFLSLKALKKDPWKAFGKKHKIGEILSGEVSKFNPFGAFIKVNKKIQGLCHISEFGSQKKMEEALEIGKKYNFEILSITPTEHRLTLRLKK